MTELNLQYVHDIEYQNAKLRAQVAELEETTDGVKKNNRNLYFEEEHEKYINANANLDDVMYGWQQDIATLERENNKFRNALENIKNLGLNVMTSDQRWGCAFSYASEAIETSIDGNKGKLDD